MSKKRTSTTNVDGFKYICMCALTASNISTHQKHLAHLANECNTQINIVLVDLFSKPKSLTNQSRLTMSNLSIHIIVYTEPSLRPNEAHVALSIYQLDSRKYYIYHVIKNAATESEMKFERQARDRDPRGSTTPHQEVPLSSILVFKFKQLNRVLGTTTVPQPKPSM